MSQNYIGQTLEKVCFTKSENDSNIIAVNKLLDQSFRKDTIIGIYEKMNIKSDSLVNLLAKSNNDLIDQNRENINKINEINTLYASKSYKANVRQSILGGLVLFLASLKILE